jgi:nicotinate-nucleotide pyrophosphorylase (carboxylating)
VRKELRPPSPQLVALLVRAALAEDIGPGDITTRATIMPGRRARARIVARQAGVLAGLFVPQATFHTLSTRLRFIPLAREGTATTPGQIIARLSGPLAAILAGERVALNFLARMSGIATYTSQHVRIARRYGVSILDTRKTSPLLRYLEKYAVCAGGGENHRFGLFDAVLIKDNHIAAAGSLAAAVERARSRLRPGQPIEAEAQNLSEVRQALAAKVELIMLDNMSRTDLKQAIRLIGRSAQTEISGGVNLANVRAYAALRPDFISIGALTHSAPALDFSLEIVPL